MIKIYLSPSNQANNVYAVGNTTEKAQMEIVAQKAKLLLDTNYVCETEMATLGKGIGYNERPLEAKQKGCHVYLAVHSNAGSPAASGAMAFYHPSQPVGKALAQALVTELDAICPIAGNRNVSVVNGMSAFRGAGYGEIRSPAQYGLVAVLVETNFHDNPKTAQWILANHDGIANAIVRALAAAFHLAPKGSAPPVPAPVGALNRVQIGAFAVKANADAMLQRAKDAGFESAYIKED
ncbi:MAG: N-acetylmuramoyl-L-alanine amidase [Ruthenibacterium sp.]